MIVGRLVRIQLGEGAGWRNINGERSCKLSIVTEWVDSSGSGRGVKHVKKRSRWSANASLLVLDVAKFGEIWERFSTIGEARGCRMEVRTEGGDIVKYEGKAYINSLRVGASNRGLTQVDLELTGTGRLREL